MQTAKDSMNKSRTREEFLQTAALFDAINDPEAAKLAKRCRKLADLTKGSQITFGSWNGEPLVWDIVAEHGKQRMLICKRLVDSHAFMDLNVNASWATSSLRRWLNNDFLKNAFTNEERMTIMFSKVENLASTKYCSEGGRNTSDRIFIPSIEELEQYLPEADRAMGRWWWLRTPGMNLLSYAAVYADGTVYDYGIRVNYTDGGVRPALWLMPRL